MGVYFSQSNLGNQKIPIYLAFSRKPQIPPNSQKATLSYNLPIPHLTKDTTLSKDIVLIMHPFYILAYRFMNPLLSSQIRFPGLTDESKSTIDGIKDFITRYFVGGLERQVYTSIFISIDLLEQYEMFTNLDQQKTYILILPHREKMLIDHITSGSEKILQAILKKPLPTNMYWTQSEHIGFGNLSDADKKILTAKPHKFSIAGDSAGRCASHLTRNFPKNTYQGDNVFLSVDIPDLFPAQAENSVISRIGNQVLKDINTLNKQSPINSFEQIRTFYKKHSNIFEDYHLFTEDLFYNGPGTIK